MNKVYLLDPDKVAATIEAKVVDYQRLCAQQMKMAAELTKQYKKKPHQFASKPSTPARVKGLYASWIAREREYYANVRVVRIKPRKYVLTYDEVMTSRTGPFNTIAKAMDWFYSQGR
jgi:predicted lipoprotein